MGRVMSLVCHCPCVRVESVKGDVEEEWKHDSDCGEKSACSHVTREGQFWRNAGRSPCLNTLFTFKAHRAFSNINIPGLRPYCTVFGRNSTRTVHLAVLVFLYTVWVVVIFIPYYSVQCAAVRSPMRAPSTSSSRPSLPFLRIRARYLLWTEQDKS